jgi:hypothetical protein
LENLNWHSKDGTNKVFFLSRVATLLSSVDTSMEKFQVENTLVVTMDKSVAI